MSDRGGGSGGLDDGLSVVQVWDLVSDHRPKPTSGALLSDHLQKVHGVEVERGQKLLGIDGGLANWEAVDGSGGDGGEFRYIFGCDGAHSRVRKEIGATFEGGQIPGDWL